MKEAAIDNELGHMSPKFDSSKANPPNTGRTARAIVFFLFCCGLPAAFPLAGCTISRFPDHAQRPLITEPAMIVPSNNQAVRTSAANELGPDAAAAIPLREHPVRGADEPVALELVNSMLDRMQDRAVGADGLTHITLSELRNQSRCSSGEFASFRDRLAELLTQAGRDSHLQFASGDEAASSSSGQSQYQLQGSAYLMTLEGFDVWELYLSLSPPIHPWTIWQANGPVHVLRQPRPGQAQMLR